MYSQATILMLAALLAGCTGGLVLTQLPPNHPANAEAAVSPLPPASTTLSIAPDRQATPAGGGTEADHGEMPHGTKHGNAPMRHDMEGMGQGGYSEHEAAGAMQPEATQVVYVCPMHPEVTADQPGQRCPKCGMELVPRDSTGEKQ